MTSDKSQQLYDKFPELLRGRHAGPQENLMCFGFECGDGWHGILELLLTKLDEIRKDRLPDLHLLQVKEKWGTLTVYASHDTEDDEVFNLCMAAEHESAFTCEDCGAPGRTRDNRAWIRTLCDQCL